MTRAEKLLEMMGTHSGHVWEMSKLNPQDTGLSRQIWIDDEGIRRQVRHSPYRVKMPARRGEPFNARTNSISFYFDKEEPYIMPKDAEHDLSGKEIKQIKSFLKRHRDLLLKCYRDSARYGVVWLAREIQDREYELWQGRRRVVKTSKSHDSTKIYLEPIGKGRKSSRQVDNENVSRVGSIIK